MLSCDCRGGRESKRAFSKFLRVENAISSLRLSLNRRAVKLLSRSPRDSSRWRCAKTRSSKIERAFGLRKNPFDEPSVAHAQSRGLPDRRADRFQANAMAPGPRNRCDLNPNDLKTRSFAGSGKAAAPSATADVRRPYRSASNSPLRHKSPIVLARRSTRSIVRENPATREP